MSEGATAALRVLVVDDDRVDRAAVRRALRSAGVEAEVAEADGVASALDALREGGFDCAFLDFRLPDGDGLRVLREMRSLGIDTPVVMLTGQEDTQLAVEVMKAGASDYLPKSAVAPERLAQSLRHAVRLHRAERVARATEDALRESEARFRVLHETSPDGFTISRAVRDGQGRVADFEWVYANPAAERMLGRGPGELLGRRMLQAFPGLRGTELFGSLVAVVEGGEPFQTELRYAHDDVDLWVRATAVRLGDGFAIGFSDITARRTAEEEREAALAARSQFYAAMSHELRTPINAILGYNDLLLAGVYGPLAPQQEHGIERSQNAARHLLELVNDVLDVSKLEAGKMEVQVEEVRVPELIEDLFTTVGPLAEGQGTELQSDCTTTGTIATDPRRVRQILLNLLSNAIKFGDGKPVRIRCSEGADGWVTVEVADGGRGIPPEAIPRIFEEFVQLPNANQGGTGLGLPISRRLADLLGGRLEAESEPGRGSTFRLHLPPAAPPSGDAALPDAQAEPAPALG
ncbi:MAG: hypothetical protein JWM27_4118 [Gemmatimonadetes bacterium]|nr:hypothetical protein [Gemmatimonadota bacterium]